MTPTAQDLLNACSKALATPTRPEDAGVFAAARARLVALTNHLVELENEDATNVRMRENTALRELIAVTPRLSPHSECYLHESVPPLASPFADEAFEERSEVAQASKQKRVTVPPEWNPYRSTRVDVDAHGRRSLVNDMK